jgi:DNA-directed RNA polymerase subunit M
MKKENGDSFLVCKCGYQEGTEVLLDEKTVKEKGKALEKNLIIVKKDDKISVLPKVKEICPKCNHNEAETWQQQMRSADEPSTHFFRCLKCKFTWREY